MTSTNDGSRMAVRTCSAVVSAGETDTEYRRAGFGAPVVLLGLPTELEAQVLQRLAGPGGGWRVVVPERTSLAALAPDSSVRESTFSQWLSGFLQGLGLDYPHIVAAAAFRDELARYAEGHPGELGPIMILGGGRVWSAGSIAELLGPSGQVGRRLLRGPPRRR